MWHVFSHVSKPMWVPLNRNMCEGRGLKFFEKLRVKPTVKKLSNSIFPKFDIRWNTFFLVFSLWPQEESVFLSSLYFSVGSLALFLSPTPPLFVVLVRLWFMMILARQRNPKFVLWFLSFSYFFSFSWNACGFIFVLVGWLGFFRLICMFYVFGEFLYIDGFWCNRDLFWYSVLWCFIILTYHAVFLILILHFVVWCVSIWVIGFLFPNICHFLWFFVCAKWMLR